jgi:hypothetical protein
MTCFVESLALNSPQAKEIAHPPASETFRVVVVAHGNAFGDFPMPPESHFRPN